MDWWRVLPLEAESGAPEASPPHTPPLSVDFAMDIISVDSSVLSLGEVPRSWVELNARIKELDSHLDLISDDSSLQSLGEGPRSHPEPSPPSPSPARHLIPLLRVGSDPEISSQDVSVLLPFCCVEAPIAHLPTTTTTTYLETSQQDGTGLPSPTRGRFGKRLTNIFSSMFSCFRSRHRVVVLDGEADTRHWLNINNPKPAEPEPVPAAKRGWPQRFLRRFRRTSRNG